MASLIRDESGNFHLRFRWAGKSYKRSLDTRDETLADAGRKRAEEIIMRLGKGWLTMPADAEVGLFIVSGGQLTAKPRTLPQTDKPKTLQQLFDLYDKDLPSDAKEGNTRYTERIHAKHLARIIGANTLVESITLATAQSYVNKRTKETYGKSNKPIRGKTAEKELKTLRIVWNWAYKLDHLQTPCKWQLGELTLDRSEGKEHFMTVDEINRRIGRNGLSDQQKAELWKCLYLRPSEVKEFLDYIQEHAVAKYLYPMMTMCALTGARRSELCRSRLDDIPFDPETSKVGDTLQVREKKRIKKQKSSLRNIPIHPRLKAALEVWLANHPGGQTTFVQDNGAPVSPDLASKHLTDTIASIEQWKHVRFHVLRHSFASILACNGVDQRIIDSMMGHQDEQTRMRYQHLFPDTKESAVSSLLP